MTATEYYRRAIWTPLILPALAAPSVWLRSGGNAHQFLHEVRYQGSLVTLLVGGLIYLGIPYLLALWSLRKRIRDGNEIDWADMIPQFPLRTMLFLIPWMIALRLITQAVPALSGSYADDLPLFIFSLFSASLFTLAVGYGWVGWTKIELWVFRKIGWVE